MHDQNNLDNLPGEQQGSATSVNSEASWGGSVASVEPAPRGRDRTCTGAQIHPASTGGGSKPEREEKPTERRTRCDLADRAHDLDRTSAEIADEREVIAALFGSRRRPG